VVLWQVDDFGLLLAARALSSRPMKKMTAERFLVDLQAHAATFAKAVATNEGEWIVKGFIGV
jgi:hypothetical protein